MSGYEALFARRTLGIRLGLPIVTDAYDRLGRPAAGLPALAVVGTNGKGSIAAMCDHALRQRGHRVGLYTSPHLVRVTERVRVDGAELDDAELQRHIAAVLAVESSQKARALSFFEVLTLATLRAFALAQVDMLVLEAGLGGRLDATRLVTPRAVAVASIDLDHQGILGQSLTAIAREKAGMFARGAAVVSGPQHPEASAVLQQMAALHGCSFREVQPLPRAPKGLAGDHQRQNAAVAVAASAVLEPSVGAEDIEGAWWSARLQSIRRRGGVLVLDAAHNLGGVEALARHFESRAPVTVVFGAQSDKPIGPMAARLAALGPLWWASLEPESAVPPQAVRSWSIHQIGARSLLAGIDEALGRGGTVLVCGSHRLLGALLVELDADGEAGRRRNRPDPGELRGA